MRPIRIGKFPYANILPLYHGFDESDLSIEWVDFVPSQINRLMQIGEIDVAPISTFAYGKDYPSYQLIPNLSVSAYGNVRSIFLYSHLDSWRQLDQKRIALTNASATSVHLLKIILEKFIGIRPVYQVMEPNLGKMMQEADAALLIGDDAIQASWRESSYYCFDLGEEWYKQTGLGMTYAVWAVRQEILNQDRAQLHEIVHRFQETKRKNLQNIEIVSELAKRRMGGNIEFWRTYYEGLCYDFHEREQSGLKSYFQFAQEKGYLQHDTPIKILNMKHKVK